MGNYNKPKRIHPQTSPHKRFCRVCGMQTYDFYHCGQRTGSINMTKTIGSEIK